MYTHINTTTTHFPSSKICPEEGRLFCQFVRSKSEAELAAAGAAQRLSGLRVGKPQDGVPKIGK